MAENKILIVDDDPDFLHLLAFDLKKNGYEVVSANNGEEGLERALKELPNLIVLDIKMPKMDGYTFVRRLKKDDETKRIPLVVLTSYEPMKDMFKLEGVDDYFAKSADMTKLLEAIAKYVKGAKAT